MFVDSTGFIKSPAVNHWPAIKHQPRPWWSLTINSFDHQIAYLTIDYEPGNPWWQAATTCARTPCTTWLPSMVTWPRAGEAGEWCNWPWQDANQSSINIEMSSDKVMVGSGGFGSAWRQNSNHKIHKWWWPHKFQHVSTANSLSYQPLYGRTYHLVCYSCFVSPLWFSINSLLFTHEALWVTTMINQS